MNTGWEVRPLGWVLLALLIGVMLYYAVIRLTRPSQRRSADTLNSSSAPELPPHSRSFAPYSTSVFALTPWS